MQHQLIRHYGEDIHTHSGCFRSELKNNVRHSYKLLEAMTEPLDEEPVAS